MHPRSQAAPPLAQLLSPSPHPTPPPSCLWLERQQRRVPRPSPRTFLNVPSRAASLPDDLCSGTSSSPLSCGKARADGRGVWATPAADG